MASVSCISPPFPGFVSFRYLNISGSVVTAKTADLSRQAIYKRHFNNVNEIIDYIHEKLNDEFNQACSQYKFTSSNLSLVFSNLAQNLTSNLSDFHF